MPLSIYDVSVPVYAKLLGGLKGQLDKAAAYAKEHDFEEAALLDARLFPDMWPFKRQVQATTNHAFRGTARLAGLTIPQITEAASSFADLHGRIDETVAFIEGVDRAAVEAGETRQITFPMAGEERTMAGLQYFRFFTLPNFYFHLTTAYNILRHNGVPIEKTDFTGPI
ncbi:MAG TPA: DUF1993 domain-containing protein [Bauldia sp.]|nr:DUF1993 domain-containing protein [Bauldia sp.]